MEKQWNDYKCRNLLASPACCDCSWWLTSSGLSALHGCPVPVWRRQTAQNSSLRPSHRQNSLMSGLAMSNADKRHKHPLLVEKSPHRAAKMLVSSLFLNTYNFKLPRVKISLASTGLEGKKQTNKKKKNSGTHMLLVYSTVYLLQQVLCYASNLLTIKTFSNALSIILYYLSHGQVLSHWFKILFLRFEDKISYFINLSYKTDVHVCQSICYKPSTCHRNV